MKKLILLAVLLANNIMLAHAQDSIVLHIAERPESREVCIDDHDVFIIHAREGYEFMWTFDGYLPNSWDSPIIISDQLGNYFPIQYTDDGGFNHHFNISYKESHVPTSFTHTQWKHQSESDSLVAVEADSIGWPAFYQFLWSTGETTRTINVTEPDIYTCEISELCGTATRTFIVRDNVEISHATCDLESNKNLVTWQTTPAQAQYIDHVIVKRDGLEVGTANYSEGSFLDDIGSDAASRTYTITAVALDGAQCPIVSYPKETIHMSYLLGIGSTIDLTWNTPTGYDLMGYNICEWHPNDGNLSVIDFVGASVTSYTCQAGQFDNGNIVIQGVEAGKTESCLLSNRSWETVGLGEQSSTVFKVYPNPANGMFTVEGIGTLRIANVLGQEIMVKEIDSNTAIELPQGIYFVQLNGTVRKIVVE